MKIYEHLCTIEFHTPQMEEAARASRLVAFLDKAHESKAKGSSGIKRPTTDTSLDNFGPRLLSFELLPRFPLRSRAFPSDYPRGNG